MRCGAGLALHQSENCGRNVTLVARAPHPHPLSSAASETQQTSTCMPQNSLRRRQPPKLRAGSQATNGKLARHLHQGARPIYDSGFQSCPPAPQPEPSSRQQVWTNRWIHTLGYGAGERGHRGSGLGTLSSSMFWPGNAATTSAPSGDGCKSQYVENRVTSKVCFLSAK